jgi:HD superfamily phosphodiesterase
MWRKALRDANAELTAADTSGHDPIHHLCVLGWGRYIVMTEPLKTVDDAKLDAIALTHDIGWVRYKDPAVLKADPRGDKHAEYSAQMARPILKRIGFPESKIESVVEGILYHDETKPWGNNNRNVDIEVKVVQDADCLEAMGAKGLARLIIYGDRHGKVLYKPKGTHEDCTIHNINWHLEVLEKRLHTKTAKDVAKRLQSFQRQYVQNFLSQHNFAMKYAEE